MRGKRSNLSVASDLSDAADSLSEPQLWEIPIRLSDGHYVAHLSESAEITAPQLLEQLRNGQYAKPFVLDDGRYRQLHLSLRFIQSRMNLKRPHALNLAYTRKMMAFLLFQPEPMHITIVGLGGGSLTKFCYRQIPHARITTIEIDQTVIDLSRLFHVPKPSARMRIVHADGAAYFRAKRPPSDVVLVDGCDQQGVAPSLAEESFYVSLRAKLRPGGMLVVNLVGAIGHSDALIQIISKAFDEQVLLLQASVGGNCIALAFNGSASALNWFEIKQRAVGLANQHKLDFVDFATRLEASARKRGVRHISRTTALLN